MCNQAMIGPYEQTGLNPYDIRIKCAVPPLCYDFSDVTSFLDQPSVQKAIGVDGSPQTQWQSCNMTVNSQFSADWMKNYQQFAGDLLGNNTRVLIYAGDVDFICNWLGNQAWTLALEWSGKAAFNAEGMHDWNGGHGAEAPSGQARSSGPFTFLRVYDAGHMVPLDQPEGALDMVNNFIFNGKWY